MRNFKYVAVLVGILAFGCKPEDTEKVTSDVKSAASDAGQALSGLTLEGKVQTALRLRKDVDASTLHISAKDGVVTVSGTVKSPEERSSVYAVVNNTVGVESVKDDDLKIVKVAN